MGKFETPPPSAARLAWQCRRGMRELDLLLQRFLDLSYAGLEVEEQRDFVRLLEYPDQLLLEYLLGRMTPSDTALAGLVARIRIVFSERSGDDREV